MRHLKNKIKLKGTRSHRDKILRNLAAAVILYEKVQTTKAKGKLVRSLIEKSLKPKSKNEITERRRLSKLFFDHNVVKKIFDLRKYYQDKNSGFLKIVQISSRVGDGAPRVMIELILPEKLKKTQEVKAKVAKPKVTVVEKKEKEEKRKEPETKEEGLPARFAAERGGEPGKKSWFERIRKKSPFGRFKNLGKKVISRRTTSK